MKYKPSPILIVLVLLMALLGILATLQYRWIGQVTESERTRLQASLQSDAAHLAEDFDREITRIFLAFQMEAVPLNRQAWNAYAERYHQWSVTSPYPDLVDQVYVVNANSRGRLNLVRFDSSTQTFVKDHWPEDLSELRRTLRQQLRQTKSKSGHVFSYNVPSIVETIPALVIPLSNLQLTPDAHGFTVSSLTGYTIVKLNQHAIQKELIPSLIRNDLHNGEQSGYEVVIFSRKNPRNIVYQTSSAKLSGLEQGDANANILSVQVQKFGHLLRESQLLINSVKKKDPDAASSKTPISVNVLNQVSGEVFVRAMPPISDESGYWRLVIRHQSGSLEQMIAHTRRRNLGVSFGILVLLGVSVAIVLIAARRSQQLARQQMEFVAAVSHELRTPLAVICSAAENLADGVVWNPQRVVQYGTLIRREGRRLTEMVEQVLELAGVHSGRKTYHLAPVDVRTLVESALVPYAPLLDEGNFSVEVELEPDLPFLHGDIAALRRALQNLLSNAMKYSGAHHWLRITAQLHKIEPRAEIWLAVTDKGVGIKPSDIPHLFDQFFRSSEAVEAQIHGSGLGLSLVKHIVEAHGGHISVQSHPGQGSTFTLHLPITSVETPEKPDLIEDVYEPTHFAYRR
ncbi:MAG: HAMP domain-containing histidine kinase [Acidobacteria bacterium]|nr:HAMP domain-containing histidine kinase [Acidobacteriota bacterium]